MKKLKYTLVLTLALLSAAACVYDFKADIQGRGGYLVVEGDILIGEFTTVKVSRSLPLSGDEPGSESVAAACFVEASHGGWIIDTRDADSSLEYRLVIESGGATYASEWAPVLQAASIDSIAYTISDDRQTMTVDVTAHGDSDNRYYRWTAKETWEYHAPFQASHYFLPRGSILKGEVIARDTVAMFENGENNYYCWNSGAVREVLIATTEQLSENRLVRHRLYSMNRYEQRISYLYSVELTQEAISQTAYKYWTMLDKNSTDVGGLFSPEPYEMRGNIKNVDDPDEMVLGYISVTRPSVTRYFIRSYEMSFAGTPRGAYDDEPVYVPENLWRRYFYNNGYDVYAIHTSDAPGTGIETEEDYEFDWLPARCVKCWLWGGGTKQKPDYWPNDHK